MIRQTGPRARLSGSVHARTVFLIGAAGVLVLVAAGIVVPAPTRVVLPITVAAPEVSAWILLVAVVVGVSAARGRGRPAGWVAGALAMVSGALAIVPLAQVPSAARRADTRLREAFGADYLASVPADVRSGMSTGVMDVRRLFTGVRPGPARVMRGVPIGSPHGTLLTLDIYRPPASGGPVVIQIYGGAWQHGTPDADPVLATYLAARGYVVFAIDYRHAPQWQWPAQLADVRDGFEWVRTHAAEYGGDATRIALLGRSSGAHLALMLTYVATPPMVRGVVSLYGPTDLTRGYRELPWPNPIGVREVLEALLGGGPDALPARYRDASPTTYASAPQPPTLQIIGGRDHVVLPRFARALDQQLRAAGNVSILLELPWAEHAFDAIPFGPGAQLSLVAVERFLAHVLTYGRNGDPRPFDR